MTHLDQTIHERMQTIMILVHMYPNQGQESISVKRSLN